MPLDSEQPVFCQIRHIHCAYNLVRCSRFGDFCVHDNGNNNATDYLTPVHARGIITVITLFQLLYARGYNIACLVRDEIINLPVDHTTVLFVMLSCNALAM